MNRSSLVNKLTKIIDIKNEQNKRLRAVRKEIAAIARMGSSSRETLESIDADSFVQKNFPSSFEEAASEFEAIPSDAEEIYEALADSDNSLGKLSVDKTLKAILRYAEEDEHDARDNDDVSDEIDEDDED
jgi:hypothetical protein